MSRGNSILEDELLEKRCICKLSCFQKALSFSPDSPDLACEEMQRVFSKPGPLLQVSADLHAPTTNLHNILGKTLEKRFNIHMGTTTAAELSCGSSDVTSNRL